MTRISITDTIKFIVSFHLLFASDSDFARILSEFAMVVHLAPKIVLAPGRAVSAGALALAPPALRNRFFAGGHTGTPPQFVV
jgi:hypothetical protein